MKRSSCTVIAAGTADGSSDALMGPGRTCACGTASGGRRGLARELADDGFEILGLAEILVDRREAHISHVVETFKPLHDGRPHGSDGTSPSLMLEPANDAAGSRSTRRGLRACGAQPRRIAGACPVERHASAGALDDEELPELHPLEGGSGRRNPGRCGGGGSLRRHPSDGVLHLGVQAAAIRATHDALADRQP